MILSCKNTFKEIEKICPATALIPVCSNPEMFDLTARLAELIASGMNEPVYLLNVWPFPASGDSGSISVSDGTIWRVCYDLAEGLVQNHISKIIFMNGLGSVESISALPVGNSIMKTIVRQMNQEIKGQQAIWFQPFRTARSLLLEKYQEITDHDLIDSLLAETYLGNELTRIIVNSCTEYIYNALNKLLQNT